MEQEILAILKASKSAVALNDIERRLGLSPAERRVLGTALKKMERRGEVSCLHGKFWQVAATRKKGRVLSGQLAMNRKMFGFVRLDARSQEAAGGARDVMVPETALGDALDGDDVVVEIVQQSDRGPRGRVVDVLRRARTTFVGRYQQTGPTRGEVILRNVRVPRRVRVPLPAAALKVESLEWVMVEVTQFTPHPDDLMGTVVERLGAGHERGIDVLMILRDRGIVEEFPASVERAAEHLNVDWAHEIPRRRDLRDLPTATIDPATAKDFDDALSIEPLKGGGWRLWVHIADVSHFVRHGDVIDREARDRATSVYPVDRVVPMLPERLSNDLCSLRPREDRLTVTCEMVVEANGGVGEATVYSSIIHSRHRLAYEQVQACFDDRKAGPVQSFADMHAALHHLRDCTRALRAARFRRGALDLDIPEVVISFHENGAVNDMGFSSRFESHKLVEDAMLAANEAVARRLTKAKAPLLYRIHEPANEERLERLRFMLSALGVKLQVGKGGLITPKDLQATLASIEGREGAHILRRLILRAMTRAEYSPENAGHFGLASDCYCHFTSPIRRYPDVVVHRQLKALEYRVALPYPNDPEGREDLIDLAGHVTWRENEAEDAERDSTRMKALEYLKASEGQEFTGRISGVAAEGFFVELEPYGVEGFVSARSLKGDRYEADALHIELVGARSGRRFRLTDEVTVRILRALPFEVQLDLELVQGEDDEAPPSKPWYGGFDGGRSKGGKGGGKGAAKKAAPKRGAPPKSKKGPPRKSGKKR